MAETKYWHYRLTEGDRIWDKPLLKGGATVCAVIEGNRIRIGVAVCSLKDAFCRKTGRDVAREAAANVETCMTIEPVPDRQLLHVILNDLVAKKMAAIYRQPMVVHQGEY